LCAENRAASIAWKKRILLQGTGKTFVSRRREPSFYENSACKTKRNC